MSLWIDEFFIDHELNMTTWDDDRRDLHGCCCIGLVLIHACVLLHGENEGERCGVGRERVLSRADVRASRGYPGTGGLFGRPFFCILHKMNSKSDLNIVKRFALALDGEEYAAAIALLDPTCVYTIRGKTIIGAEAVIASYQGNGDAAQKFDSIAYGSSVCAGDSDPKKGWIVIEFWDEITHRGRSHRHQCEQWARVVDGAIVEIEHRDLEGEVETLAAFKAWCGV